MNRPKKPLESRHIVKNSALRRVISYERNRFSLVAILINKSSTFHNLLNTQTVGMKERKARESVSTRCFHLALAFFLPNRLHAKAQACIQFLDISCISTDTCLARLENRSGEGKLPSRDSLICASSH